MIGPPKVPPNWLYRSFVFCWANMLRALSTSFCTNSNSDPWNSFVPLFVIMFSTEVPLPNSALKLSLMTVKSLTAPIGGTKAEKLLLLGSTADPPFTVA